MQTFLNSGLSTAQATHGASPVPLAVPVMFSLLLVGLIAAKKSVIAGCFAFVSLFAADALDLLPIGSVTNVFGEEVELPVYVPGIDWNVIAIILGASLFVDVTSRSGLFTWIAIRLTKISAGDPRRLLFYYGGMTVLFSAVLNNVTAMIIVGSLTGVSLNKLGRRDKLLGFLLVEGLLTIIGGQLKLISSVFPHYQSLCGDSDDGHPDDGGPVVCDSQPGR